MSQPTLFTPPPADGKLGHRQQIVLDLLRANPDGSTVDEVAAALHVGCRFCREGQLCRFARGDAKSILRKLRKPRELARYRIRTKRWYATSGVQHPQSDIPF